MSFGAWTMEVKGKRRWLCQKQKTCATVYFHCHFGDFIQPEIYPLHRADESWTGVLFRWAATPPQQIPGRVPPIGSSGYAAQ